MAERTRVLIIEDLRETRDIFRFVLEFYDYEVLGASGTEEGVRLAREQRPDVIVADLAVPGLSGLDLARILRDDERTADIPIVAVTGSVASLDRVPESEPVFSRVLRKPVAPRELVGVIEDFAGAA